MAAVSSVVSPTALSDAERAVLAPLVPPAKPGGRPRRVDVRTMLDGIFYVLRAGCQWRLLPRTYGPWSTVYAYFRRWRLDGSWEQIHATLRERFRRQLGRESTPSAAILDSQSVKTTELGDPHGYDGAKKLSGRKRHLLVDTLGLVLKVQVHAADIQDRSGARNPLLALRTRLPRLELLGADAAYVGPLQISVQQTCGWRLRIVERLGGRGQWLPAGQEPPVRPAGFQVLPRRWVVERTFAWLGRYRRLSKDYERVCETTETLIYIAMARLMLRRLASP